jgi:hypothetical protein
MEWKCELPLRPERHFLVPAAARELKEMVRSVPIVLGVDPNDLTRRGDELGEEVGAVDSSEMVIAADGWPRVKITCRLDSDKLPHSIREGLAAGTVGVGFAGRMSTHRCKGDDEHTMIGGFNALEHLAIVPVSAEPVDEGPVDEPVRMV